MNDPEQFLRIMIQSLVLVAADADSQIGFLPNYVHAPDEVVSTFDEAFLLFDQVVEAGLVVKKQIDAILAVNDAIDDLSANGNEEMWTIHAMRFDHRWQNLRKTARMALDTFGDTPPTLSLDWITYVRGNRRPFS